jgi:hypothetical protein
MAAAAILDAEEKAALDARRADLAALRNGPARQYRMRHELAGEPVYVPAIETYAQFLDRLATWQSTPITGVR